MKAKELVEHIMKRVKGSFVPVIAHQVYSTNEQVIGVWTDGKPLYRKVLEFEAIDSNKESKQSVSDLHIDQMVEIKGIWQRGDTSLNWYPFAGIDTQFNGCTAAYGKQEEAVYVFPYNNYPVSAAYVFIQYTKTTDTSTTSKVPFEPLHEYSTEEKLVGYWIDGKAVYEKTVSLSEPFTLKNGADWQIVDNSLSENLTLISAELFRNSGELINARQISAKTNGLAIIAPDSSGVKIIGYTLRYTKTTD